MPYYRYRINYENPTQDNGLAIYNQYTGQLFATKPTDATVYDLQDGDVVMVDPSYYDGGANAPYDPITGNPLNFPFAGSFTLTAIEYDDASGLPTGTMTPDVMGYSDQADPNAPANPVDETANYPSDPVGTVTDDPGYVEVDPEFFDSYDEYYDEDDQPVYEGSACDSSIGIRG